jgi:hypothetical protein
VKIKSNGTKRISTKAVSSTRRGPLDKISRPRRSKLQVAPTVRGNGRPRLVALGNDAGELIAR